MPASDPLERFRTALSAGKGRIFLGKMSPFDAAACVRRALLDRTLDLGALAKALPPVRLPHLDEAEASASLAEEAILLGADPGPVPPPEGDARLGWALSAEGQLVPVHALAWRDGRPPCPWDSTVRRAEDWLRSPNRILALSPQLLPFVSRANDAPHGILPLDRRLRPLRALGEHSESGAAALAELAAQLELAAEPPGADERLHAVLLAHGEAVAPALAQAAAQSLFFGADAELWAARLELLLPPESQLEWSTRPADGKPRLLHRKLAEALCAAGPKWILSEAAERWLRVVAARTGATGIAARAALAAHRRPWFTTLPASARAETLDLLGHTGTPIEAVDWVLRGAMEGLGESEVALVADAWRARNGGGRPELNALLGALALPDLDVGERGRLVAQVQNAPESWRVGLLVNLMQAAARAGDQPVVEELATTLERLAQGGRLAVAAAVGLLQLVRQDVIRPKARWLARIREAIQGPVARDPRVLRELDLAS